MTHQTVVFITPEIAVHRDLPTYTGGLGYLAGTLAFGARHTSLPAIVIAPLGRYYEQGTIDTPDGKRMLVEDKLLNHETLLERTGIELEIPMNGEIVCAQVWRFPGEQHASIPVYFIDTDYEKNSDESRKITPFLYGGYSGNGASEERRIKLSLLLGVGSVMLIGKLGIPVSIYHLNEGHCVFAALELFRREIADGGHDSIGSAIRAVRRKVLFTTHTPVPAGIWRFNMDLLEHIAGSHFSFDRKLWGLIGGEDHDFNTAVAGIRLAGGINAVSQRHETTARKMWSWVYTDGSFPLAPEPIRHVTNGVCREFWQDPRYLKVQNPDELARAKLSCKRDLIRYVTQKTGRCLGENVLTAVFARRWTRYKRPGLILDGEFKSLKAALGKNRMQLIFAGMPNPDEHEMVNLWNHILALSEQIPNLVILPGYDLTLSKLLKAGADLWINNPAAPKEACGTSGMSANLNGALNISTPDGWMLEAEPKNHILFGHDAGRNWDQQWTEDAAELREHLIRVTGTYYDERDDWNRRALNAMREAESRWTGLRMIEDYRKLHREVTGQ